MRVTRDPDTFLATENFKGFRFSNLTGDKK